MIKSSKDHSLNHNPLIHINILHNAPINKTGSNNNNLITKYIINNKIFIMVKLINLDIIIL